MNITFIYVFFFSIKICFAIQPGTLHIYIYILQLKYEHDEYMYMGRFATLITRFCWRGMV